MKAVIQGIGVLGGFGCGIRDLYKNLNGKPPAGEKVEIDTPEGSVLVNGLLAQTDLLSDFIPKRTLRRMGHHIRVALLAAFSALKDARMLDSKDRGRMGIIVATGYGSTTNNYDFQNLSNGESEFIGSPTVFINSVHNAAAAYISIALGENGPNHTVSHYDMSFPAAVLSALQWLREDRVDSVLVGAVDDFSKARAFDLYSRNLGSGKKPHPVSVNDSNSLKVGEGACFFVLSKHHGKCGEYGYIDQVKLGRRNHRQVFLPDADAFITQEDSLSINPVTPPGMIPSNSVLGVYTRYYGLMPVSESFDLAVAALSLKNRFWFPSSLPGVVSAPEDNTCVPESEHFTGQSICVFKLGIEKTIGYMVLQNR